VLNELTMPSADAIRAGARRFHQLVISDGLRAAPPPCSPRACRPAARSNSTSATALAPCGKYRGAGRGALARTLWLPESVRTSSVRM